MANVWQAKKLGAWGSDSSLLKKKGITSASPASNSISNSNSNSNSSSTIASTKSSVVAEPHGETKNGKKKHNHGHSNNHSNGHSNGHGNGHNNGESPVTRPAFNTSEVKRFLASQFEQQSKSSVTLVIEDSKDWNTAQSKARKSKKYGCLSELERVLK